MADETGNSNNDNDGDNKSKQNNSTAKPKLHAEAKAFVPSFALHATAKSWSPPPGGGSKDSAAPAKESGGPPAAAAAAGANNKAASKAAAPPGAAAPPKAAKTAAQVVAKAASSAAAPEKKKKEEQTKTKAKAPAAAASQPAKTAAPAQAKAAAPVPAKPPAKAAPWGAKTAAQVVAAPAPAPPPKAKAKAAAPRASTAAAVPAGDPLAAAAAAGKAAAPAPAAPVPAAPSTASAPRDGAAASVVQAASSAAAPAGDPLAAAAAKAPVSAWGKKPSDAIRAAPTPTQQAAQQPTVKAAVSSAKAAPKGGRGSKKQPGGGGDKGSGGQGGRQQREQSGSGGGRQSGDRGGRQQQQSKQSGGGGGGRREGGGRQQQQSQPAARQQSAGKQQQQQAAGKQPAKPQQQQPAKPQQQQPAKPAGQQQQQQQQQRQKSGSEGAGVAGAGSAAGGGGGGGSSPPAAGGAASSSGGGSDVGAAAGSAAGTGGGTAGTSAAGSGGGGGGGGGGGWAKIAKQPAKPQPPQQPPQQQQQPPQQTQQRQQQQPPQQQQRQRSHGGREGGGGGGPHVGKGQKHQHQQQPPRGGDSNRDGGGGGGGGWQRGKSLPVELCTPGEGTNDAEKSVVRHTAMDLLAVRLSYLAPPLVWGAATGDGFESGPPGHCAWTEKSRVSEIDSMAKAPRMGGDVSHDNRKRKGPKQVDTAPALEDCKPLEVNNDTRWKAGVMKKDAGGGGKDGEGQGEGDSDDEVLKKALLILNKLSLTKFDKLSDDFINTGIGRNEHTLHDAIWTIVSKAQDEPHFSAMYAALCLKLARTPLELEEGSAKKGKRFKKLLLERCQEEFETDTATKIAKATEGIDDEDERKYHAALVKKHYLGHMRFIGELYKGDLISIKIMIYCLPALLVGEVSSAAQSTEEKKESNDEGVDEEKVECFTKLMTTIGSSLEQQSAAMKSVGKADAADKLGECWNTVETMAGVRKVENAPEVSNRIKFMLQDLLETRKNGWVTRRKEETAKTIAQIHKEVAKEEARAKRSSSSASLRRLGSTGDVRRMSQPVIKPSADKDGFVTVNKQFGRSVSMGNMTRGGVPASPLGKKNVKRVPSGSSFAALVESPSEKRRPEKNKDRKEKAAAEEPKKKEATKPHAKSAYKSPDECGDKAKNILKEYFVGGDADDAVLSFHEMIGTGDEGSVERGAKSFEGSVMLVLEMKKEDVEKFLTIAIRLVKEKKLEGESITTGLNDPLEFLSDIAIDAPLAGDHLATVVSEFIKLDAIALDFLLNSPEYFRTDCNSAQFAVKVVKKLGDGATEDESNLAVVEKLMTCEDKEATPTAKEFVAAC